MKGYRFYLEHDTPSQKRKGEHSGNVFALELDSTFIQYNGGHSDVMMSGFAAVYDRPDSPCMYTNVSRKWIMQNCKRITEARAREVHPNLFERMQEA